MLEYPSNTGLQNTWTVSTFTSVSSRPFCKHTTRVSQLEVKGAMTHQMAVFRCQGSPMQEPRRIGRNC